MPQLSLAVRQQMRIAPMMVNLARLLQLNSLDLHEAVQDELAANPALEEIASIAPLPGAAAAGDEQRLLTVVAPRSPAEVLLEELRISLPASERGIAKILIGSLDERGFLTDTPAKLARHWHVEAQRIRTALDILQAIGPPGIGARNVRESLLAQVARLEALGVTCAHVRAIIADHLEALGAGRYRTIAGALHVRIENVVSAHEFIKSQLRLFPLQSVVGDSRREPDARCYRMPDIAFVVRGSTIVVEATASPSRSLRISPIYLELAQEHRDLDTGERAHIQQHIEQARSFLRGLRRREQTLRLVGEALARRQEAFLRHGVAHLVPLTRLAIAQDIGMHESTVCRAVAGKHARLLTGAIAGLDEFFAAARPAQEALRELIVSEERPLSDSELAELLAQQGYPLARRTVAKYREQLGIPLHRLRKNVGRAAVG